MMPMSTTHHKIHSQSGVSIVTAIFLVVVLALMGVGMVSILTTSKQSISQEFTSAKAYMAARSCLQWGMYQSVYDADPWTDSPYVHNFNASALSNTRCSTAITTINADSLNFFNITSIASIGSNTDPEYSRRELQMQFQP